MPSPRILRNLRLPPDHRENDLVRLIAREAGRPEQSIRPSDFRIIHQSVDARHPSSVCLEYAVELDPEPLCLAGIAPLLPRGEAAMPATPHANDRPVIAGAGPAGLFAALFLSMAGMRPILIEQGKPVEERAADVERYWKTGLLDPRSNVQFGEGGAGTFSDGKLTTGIKDPRCRMILEELVMAGAPDDILFLAKPHVGTDRLRTTVINLRRKIEQHGGEIRFGCRLANLFPDISGHRVAGMAVEQLRPGALPAMSEIPARQVILAIGHSSRETIRQLSALRLDMEPKPFSIGVRIEHPQALVNRIRYGRHAGLTERGILPPADYKLSCHLASGRSVYTFCMCPGGQVIAAASGCGSVVTNGMSGYRRDMANANSALLVGVGPADFPEPGPLGGVAWQEKLERAAFEAGGCDGRAPAQRLGDFLGRAGENRTREKDMPGFQDLEPSYRPGVAWRDLDDILPSCICRSLREAIPALDQKMSGFADARAILTGVETRSSSPLRMIRGTTLESNLEGLYPCGEGAGYAGGIMSAAADGLRCAEAVLQQSR